MRGKSYHRIVDRDDADADFLGIKSLDGLKNILRIYSCRVLLNGLFTRFLLPMSGGFQLLFCLESSSE